MIQIKNHTIYKIILSFYIQQNTVNFLKLKLKSLKGEQKTINHSLRKN